MGASPGNASCRQNWRAIDCCSFPPRYGKSYASVRCPAYSYAYIHQTESQIVPSTTVLHQAFFPPKKSPWVQLIWWASGSLANVLLQMVAYKLIQNDNAGTLVGNLAPWKWLHLICVVLTFVVALPLMFFLPNTPVDAKWLSTEEKIHTIARIRETHSGISNSVFKWSQVRECFTDPKSWLFM